MKGSETYLGRHLKWLEGGKPFKFCFYGTPFPFHACFIELQICVCHVLTIKCPTRVLDMSHCLIQQTKKSCQVFGVVKERIVTNQPCSVVEELQQAGSCAGTFSLRGLKSPKVKLEILTYLFSTISNLTLHFTTCAV